MSSAEAVSLSPSVRIAFDSSGFKRLTGFALRAASQAAGLRMRIAFAEPDFMSEKTGAAVFGCFAVPIFQVGRSPTCDAFWNFAISSSESPEK